MPIAKTSATRAGIAGFMDQPCALGGNQAAGRNGQLDHVHGRIETAHALSYRGWNAAIAASRGPCTADLLADDCRASADGGHLPVGQVDDDPGFVAVADGERDALVLMEAPHPDAWKLRARPLQAVNFGNAVRYSAYARARSLIIAETNGNLLALLEQEGSEYERPEVAKA